MINRKDFCKWGKEVVEKETAAIKNLLTCINDDFAHACELIFANKGRLIVIGLGKSGHIGNKIAATLASTGTPAFFVHAAEATHGDFGMITAEDIVLAISNSGKTNEILTLLPFIKHLNIPLISITGNPTSPLAKSANINLNIDVLSEAGPLDLAPTSSTTACLVMGDALAIALLHARDFKKEDFARAHPGGMLGKRLLLNVQELMRTGEKIPKVANTVSLKDALCEMTTKHLGMTTIVDSHNKLLGIFTDGDLRRTFEDHSDLEALNIAELMTQDCITTTPEALAFETFNEMECHKITAIPVLDENKHVIGIIHLHDILQSGVI